MAFNPLNTISFHYSDVKMRVKEPLLIKSHLAALMALEKTTFARIKYIFCTDEFLLGLNKQFLNHDTYTDILTFTLSLPKEAIVSEIYISADRVGENAKENNVSFDEELLRVMIHGLLHLCGYTDASAEEKRVMREREDFYLQKFRS